MVADRHQRAGADLGVERAGGVGDEQRLRAGRLQRAHRAAHRAGVAALVDVRAALQAGDREPGQRAERERAGVPVHARLREVGQLGVRDRDGVLERVGDRSEARAEDDRPSAAASAALPRSTVGRLRLGRNSGPNDSGSSSSSVAVARAPRRRAGGRCASSGMNSRSRWRQPPHGTQTPRPSAITAASSTRLRPGRDQHADRRRLGALPLRVGGVLDVGAGVDRPVLGAQRGADVEARVRRVGAAHRLAGGRHQRVGAEQAVRVGVGEDRSSMPSASLRRATFSRSAPGPSPAARRPRARRTSRARRRCRGGCGRPPTAAGGAPSRPRRACRARRRATRAARRGRRPARAGSGSRAPTAASGRSYWISAAPPGVLLAQLQPPVARRGNRCRAGEHAAVLGAELAAGRRASARGPGRAP